MKNKMDTWTIISGIVAVALLLFTIVSYLINSIDTKLEEKISDPNFVKKVADEVRLPFVIFDEDKKVLANVGGFELLESFKIIKNDKGELTEIQITPRTFLSVAPILESIGANINFLEPHRAKDIDWHYKVDTGYGGFLVNEGYKEPIKKFRLTIIK